jgi:hypothetical protein
MIWVVLGILLLLGLIGSIKTGGVTLIAYLIGLVFCGIFAYNVVSDKEWKKRTLGDITEEDIIRFNSSSR